MNKTRIDQDALHQESSTKIDQVRLMKKECEWTRKALPKYLHGHLFKIQQRRVARHLEACSRCSSEYHSLRYAADTRQLLREITPAEGMTAHLRHGFSFLGKIRTILYRPLWVLLGASIVVFLYFFVVAPSRHDPELENIENSLPPAAVSAVSSSLTTTGPALTTAPAAMTSALEQKDVPPVEPLAITIMPDDQSSIKRINDVMKSYAALKKLRFSATVREVSGIMTIDDLHTLFSRMEQAGRVRYSKRRFDSFPKSGLIPFVMKLNDALPATEKSAPAAQPGHISSPSPSAQP